MHQNHYQSKWFDLAFAVIATSVIGAAIIGVLVMLSAFSSGGR